MGTAPVPAVKDVLKFYRVQLSSNLVYKAGFPSKVHELHLWVYKAFNMFTTQIFVSWYGLNVKTSLTFQVVHFGKL